MLCIYMEIFIVIALIFICYKLQGMYNILFDMYGGMIKYKINKDE